MIDIQLAFKKKTELLCKGLFLDEEYIDHYKTQDIQIDYGRKGGAGPSGGRYFLLEDDQTLVNVALWNDSKKTNLVLRDQIDDYLEIYDNNDKSIFGKVKVIQNPNFYALKSSEGIPLRQIALVHGIDCLATTIYQKCKYWACGEACSFCGIEYTLNSGATILEKTSRQILEVIEAAKLEKRCSHMTLTSGTPEGQDKGANRYIELLKDLKNVNPDIPLHIQIEPVEDLQYINQLKEAGADTIGIHIEIPDQLIREIITPGKAKIPYRLYEENWKHSVDIFGKNQVESFILTGFGESSQELLMDLEKVISIGVIPNIMPVRSIQGKKSMPMMNYNVLLEIYSKTARLMKEYGINPLEHKAGCVRCGGCSAINEAYKAVR